MVRLVDGKVHSFRLEPYTERSKLWSHRDRYKNNTANVHTLIRRAREEETGKLVRKNVGNTQYFLNLRQQYGTDQKAFDRIFDLNIERHRKLISQAPHREKTVEKKEHIAPQPENPLEKIEQAFPQKLRDLLSFQIEGTNAILRPTRFLDWKTELTPIKNVVYDLKGKWIWTDAEGKTLHWNQQYGVIPL